MALKCYQFGRLLWDGIGKDRFWPTAAIQNEQV
jgi:hypothetical protein